MTTKKHKQNINVMNVIVNVYFTLGRTCDNQ